MHLSEENQQILLLSIHQSIEENACHSANELYLGQSDQLINYPSNGGLTEAETAALAKLKGDEAMKSALRKLFASNSADVFFKFLIIIDGTSNLESRDWTGVCIVDTTEDYEEGEFLHDEFYTTYWDWREKRKNKNWKLDLLED